MSLIVTGSIGIDTIETHDGRRADQLLGGSTFYFAAAARLLMPSDAVRLVGAVGEDFPPEFIEQFGKLGVDTQGIERRVGSKSFRWHGKYHEDMDHRDTVSVDLNVLIEDLPPVPGAYRDSKYVFLAVTSPDNQLALMDQFPDKRMVVADTIDLYIQTQREALDEVVRRVDGLIINDSEAALLTEQQSPVAAAEVLLDRGPKFVVIKKGKHGALLCHADGWCVLPAFPTTHVADPTGAGDSFAGGFMGSLAAAGAGPDDLPAMRRALADGTVVASFTIESFGVDAVADLDADRMGRRRARFIEMLEVA